MLEGTEVARPPARGGRARMYVRPKTTPRRVVWIDRAADFAIRTGGLLVIFAVFAILAFLVQVVVPLFSGGSLESTVHSVLPPPPAASGARLALLTDEYDSLGVEVFASGAVRAFHLASGRIVAEATLPLGAPATAFARTPETGDTVFGFADGSLRFARIAIDTQVLPDDALPAGLTALGGTDGTDGSALYSAIPGRQIRRVAPRVELVGEATPATGHAIVALDLRVGGSAERPTRAEVAVDDSGAVALLRRESKKNLLTGAVTESISRLELPRVATLGPVAGVLMTQRADEVLLAERSGTLYRFDLRDAAHPQLAETVDLVPGEGQLTSLAFLIGEQSLVAGASDGSVDVWFRVERSDAGTTDGRSLVRAHALEPQKSAVTSVAPSQRSKLFATADAGGDVWVRHATSEQVALRLPGAGHAVSLAALAPRDDGVLAVDAGGGATHWGIRVPHPETTLRAIFGRIWYEGYPRPTFTWQSSSGNDLFEPKLSLVPLIFGTLKATFYSLLFAVPIALMAAVYTSEFVHPRVRTAVKPTMEMMASLPSVVLGFIAALVLAPVVETWIASVVLLFFALPLALFLAAYLWQLLPRPVALRFEGLPKFALMFATVGAGVYGAYRLGPAFERLLFSGDFRAWLAGAHGSGAPFLFLLLLPPSFAAVAIAGARGFGGALRTRIRTLSRTRAGALDGAVWLATLACAALLAAALASALAALGLDPRGGLVGTYVQRNTLVVGFAMGFAVIPIVYTIAEDAMSAVPSHLRAASLGCGATPWQTAINVVVPTAMSGIFAGIMIGMGRAVGETMIVVMAAGNTPILDPNVFSGLRALSANIAVELPEAVKDGSLYRMLFLAALTLFAMTFVVNTLAELVRLRFRRRAAEL